MHHKIWNFLITFLDLQIIYKGLEILGENEQKIQFFSHFNSIHNVHFGPEFWQKLA